MAARSEEKKLSDTIGKSLDSFTFRPGLFAYFMTAQDVKVQEALLDALVACVDAWTVKYDNGNYDDEEMNVLAKAKRVSESLSIYRL